MSDLTINTEDITAALKKNLEGFSSDLTATQVGRVLEVGDGIARVSGLPEAAVNEMLEFENGAVGLALNLDEDSIGAVLLGSTDGNVHVFTMPSALGSSSSSTPRRAVPWTNGREGHERAQVCEKNVAVPVALFAPASVVRNLGGSSSRVILTGDELGYIKVFCERNVDLVNSVDVLQAKTGAASRNAAFVV